MPLPPMPTKWMRVDAAHAVVHARASRRRDAGIARSRSSASGCAVRARGRAPSRSEPRPAGPSSSRSCAASDAGVSSRFGQQHARRRRAPGTARCASGGRRPRPGTAPASRRHAGGRELGDRQRAGAADGEVGPAVGAGHVVDERRARRPRCRATRRPPRVSSRPLRAGLVQHLGTQRRAAARASAAGTHGVEARRALAAAEHEQAHRALARRRSARSGGAQRGDLRRAPDCRRARACDAAAEAARESRRARASARRASTRLVRPAMAFCSWITSGRRSSHAATPPGPETKPPAPSTTRGRWRRTTRSAWHSATRQPERRGAAASQRPCRAGRSR